MIYRIVTLVETRDGTPIMSADGVDEYGYAKYIQTGWANPTYAPRENQFDASVHHISAQGDSDFYVCYRNARNRAHKQIYILWRHGLINLVNLQRSTGLYACWTRKSRVDELETSPLNGVRLGAYCRLATHGWRWYVASGADSAIDPITGEPIGAVTEKLVLLLMQPPAVVNDSHPFTDSAHPTLTITDITPTIPSSLGAINLKTIAQSDTDGDDELTESD